MSDRETRIAALSPEKRALLAQWLGPASVRSEAPLGGFQCDPAAPIPLSFAQERLWFLEQLANVGPAYHIAWGVRLSGALDAGALRAALDAIVARHDALRTTFSGTDGLPRQVIAPAGKSAFPLLEFELGAHAETEVEFRRLASAEMTEAFDLEKGPLVRGRLIRVAQTEHALMVTAHHSVWDGWSMGIFTRELSALYGAFAGGQQDPLPSLRLQYADYAAWQRQSATGEALNAKTNYWREALAGAPYVLTLPTDRPRPAMQDYAGDVVSVTLDANLTAGLRALSARHDATLFHSVLAGWAIVLSRLAGQQDIVVGTATANRGRRELEGLIGFFVNTLALRVDLSAAPTVGDLLQRVKARAIEAQVHEDLPFEQVVELLRPTRSLAHSPLFQVFFGWLNAPTSRLVLPGVTTAPLGEWAAQRVAARFDLTLELREIGDRVVGKLEYATALFDRTTIERYAGYFNRALEGMVENDHLSVANLEILPPGERQALVNARNATDAPFADDACLHELVERQVALTPEAVAVVCESEQLTYAELDRRANRLAHHLRTLGVAVDSRVATCLDRGPELIVALLAVLKAGGAYVPLDPVYPVERLRYLLADSSPVAVLAAGASRQLAELACPSGQAIVDVADAAAPWRSGPTTAPSRGALVPDHAAYVIYTSGSTGRPKGVVVTHRNVGNLLAAMRRVTTITATDRLFATTTVSFDIAALEIFLPLVTGACTIVLDSATTMDPNRLAAAIVARAATMLQATPSLWRMLVDSGWEGGAGLRALCGGEALPSDLAAALHARVATLSNVYGPTETTIWSSAMAWETQTGAPLPYAPLGQPLANTRMYVLGERGELVPPGVAGELYIGGLGVARGYLGRPGLTAERFVPDPFDAPGRRLYRTGDRVRWRADGTIEFLGRLDFQVKVRGHRIELGEIEAQLASHPDIRAAIVTARQMGAADMQLVAYYVADRGAELEVDALRAFLAHRLPGYMAPAAFVRLPALPLTPNGKVDRAALPAPDSTAYTVAGYEAPVGDVEVALASIWVEVLGIERVGRHDDFFALGGHSLLAVRVVARVRERLGVELPVAALFRAARLVDFAAELAGAARATLPPMRPLARGADGAPTAPPALSFAQERLWFLDQLGGLGPAYHISWGRRISGALDPVALRRALDALVARHEVLRTTFEAGDGDARQIIASPNRSRFELSEQDMRRVGDVDGGLGELARSEALAPFDLARGPLIRGRLVRIGEAEHAVLMTMHHVVADGWSAGVFMRELSALYAAFAIGAPDPLPPLAVQYADYAAWQREWVTGDILREQTDYWVQTLRGAPELLTLPTDRPRPAVQQHGGAVVPIALDTVLVEQLKALGRREGATLFHVLLAAWAVVLGRLAGQSEVVIGTPTANRGQTELEGLIGFFVNTLAMRVDLAGSPTVAELVARVKAAALGAQQHQELPFERVVEVLQPSRSLSHTPLFQAMLAWQNVPAGGLTLPGLDLRPLGGGVARTAKFDLTLELQERDGRIVGGLEYATALWERSTAERYAGYLRRVLDAMSERATLSIERIGLLSDSERQQVVGSWNDTDAEFPRDCCLHALVEMQAARTPQAVALVFGENRVSYAAMNADANRLADYLRALGVRRGVRVALCLERSPSMVVAVLAVLKAGGAFVPLDPASPEGRLRDMIDDCTPAAILTDSVSAARLSRLFDDRGAVVALDTQASLWAARPAADVAAADVGTTPLDIAYVTYTSGSTGRPKGVPAVHQRVVNLVHWYADACDISEGQGVMLAMSYSFDGSYRNMFAPLMRGARLHLAADPFDPVGIAREIGAGGVDVLNVTPTAFHAVFEAAEQGELSRLRLGVLVGEAPQPSRLMDLPEPRPAFMNLYGPTECSGIAVFHRLDANLSWYAEHGVPAGRPIANGRLYVMDGNGNPAPIGAAGEVCIGGTPVGPGYLARPGLTAERFVPDPLAAARGEAGARMYRTGDLGRWRSNGDLEHLGRADHQLKVRGVRVEPGEIEARLAEHPGVRDAVVVGRADRRGDVSLVAYVVGADSLDLESLRPYLAEGLPDAMVPSAYVRLDALPLTSSGKIDRRALPAPDVAALAGQRFEAPLGEIETTLASIWAEVLGIERVGRHDDFFALGGHSLRAVRLATRVRGVMLVELPIRTVFESPTVASMAVSLLATRASSLPDDVLETYLNEVAQAE